MFSIISLLERFRNSGRDESCFVLRAWLAAGFQSFFLWDRSAWLAVAHQSRWCSDVFCWRRKRNVFAPWPSIILCVFYKAVEAIYFFPCLGILCTYWTTVICLNLIGKNDISCCARSKARHTNLFLSSSQSRINHPPMFDFLSHHRREN